MDFGQTQPYCFMSYGTGKSKTLQIPWQSTELGELMHKHIFPMVRPPLLDILTRLIGQCLAHTIIKAVVYKKTIPRDKVGLV